MMNAGQYTAWKRRMSLPIMWTSSDSPGTLRQYFWNSGVAILALRIADASHVAGQRVVPDVKDLVGIIGPGNAPFQAAAADGNIAQPAFHEAFDLIHAVIGFHKLRMARVQFEQTFLKRGQFEEVVIFADQLRRAPADVAVYRVRVIGNIPLVRDAVAALVALLVNVAMLSCPNQQSLHGSYVVGMIGIDEAQASSGRIPDRPSPECPAFPRAR